MDIKLTTADGEKIVRHWGYRLQGGRGKKRTGALKIADLEREPHDLIVMDFSADGSGQCAFSESDIQRLKNRTNAHSVIVAYICIGEASDYRDHWRDDWTTYTDANLRAAGTPTEKAPRWLGAWNESWPNSRKVRYWDPDWQRIIFDRDGSGWLDRIVAAGFDGAYLDIIDGYYHWGCEVPGTAECRTGDPQSEREAAARMIDFVAKIADHARQSNPEFLIIPQNGAFIIDALEDEDHKRRDAYLEAINAIACEDLFCKGDKPENNQLAPDEEAIDALVRDFLDSGRPVLCVDYLSEKKKIAKFYSEASKSGFLPYAAPSRELNVMGAPYDGSAEAVA